MTQQLIPNITQDAFSSGWLCCVSHLQRQEDYAVLISHSMGCKAFRLEPEYSSQYQTSHCKAKVTPAGEQGALAAKLLRLLLTSGSSPV